jgi:hypothetical protein
MSGIIANRSGTTDVYAHCHSIPNPDYETFDSTETQIVKILTTGKTLSIADTQILPNYEVVKTSDSAQVMPVCYPADTIEQDAILASVYKNNTVTFGSNSAKLSKPSSNSFSLLNCNEIISQLSIKFNLKLR